MRGLLVCAGCIVLDCGAAFSQEGNTKFEVASVRPSTEQTATPANSGMKGGPGTADPERLTYTNIALKTILLRAYGVLNYRLSGPDWLNSARFNIVAKVPPGATKEQLTLMLQNLVVERFNLTFHHETKEMLVYELTAGKNGPKLKESDLSVQPPEREPGSPPRRIGGPDKDGFPQVPADLSIMLGRMTDGIMRWTGRQQLLSDLASFLGGELERPVVDKTGLPAKYDFGLAYSRTGLRQTKGDLAAAAATPANTPSEPGPSLLSAVQEQLGLNLESKKDPIDILVIDHIDKVPADN